MVKWLIRAAVSAVVVAVLLAVVPFDAVTAAVRRVSPWTWAASVAVFFAGHYLNALKLRMLIGAAGPATRPDAGPPHAGRHLTSACVRAQYAGLVANLGLPGLASGDLVRAAYLAPIAGVARVTAASIVDRLLDLGTVLAFAVLALPLAGVPPAIADVFGRAGLWVAGGAALAAVVVFVVVRRGPGSGLTGRIREAAVAFGARPAALVAAMLMSLGVQASFVVTNIWLARQAGVDTGVAAWFVAWPLSKLVAVLPISLGGIGVREAALVTLLAPYGAPRDAVLASGFLWQGVLIVTAIAGLAITQLWPRPAIPAAPARKETSA